MNNPAKTVTTDTAVTSFRKMLKRSLLLDPKEQALFDLIPEEIFKSLLNHNFNGNLNMAERVLMNRYKEIDSVDRVAIDRIKQTIHQLPLATQWVSEHMESGNDVLFITDNDNDGSLAQAILIEFQKLLPPGLKDRVHLEYWLPTLNSKVRGISLESVNAAFETRGWDAQREVLIVTADNGINNQTEVERIQAVYKNARILITDHHLPDAQDVVRENARVKIFNPQYKTRDYFKEHNISGSDVLGVLLRSVTEKLSEKPENELVTGQEKELILKNIQEIGLWGNLLDYAHATMADMPVRPYIVDKALSLRPLLNVAPSMSNLINQSVDRQVLQDIAGAAKASAIRGETNVTADWLEEQLNKVQALNAMARKLLGIYTNYRTDTMNAGDFHYVLAQELANPEFQYNSVNPNYIEQLRPYIFNLSAIDNKDQFLSLLNESMISVFDDLRHIEKTLLRELRQSNLLSFDRQANSTIMFPIHPSLTKVFNRRLLGKAYNEDNNGFLLTLNEVTPTSTSGSMRSQYDIEAIMADKEEIEETLGINIKYMGHSRAAGFRIEAKPGEEITPQVINDLNRWLDDRIQELRQEEKRNFIPTVEVDFAAIPLVEKINRAVKANLAGMREVPTIIRFSADPKHGVWITDNETTEQINLEDLIERKSYGYQAIRTDFHGSSIIVPVEQLRSIVESGYKKALRLSYMNEGVFMASQVVDPKHLNKIQPVLGGKAEQEDLVDYYKNTYSQGNFIPLKRENLAELPYFKYNPHGAREFLLLEAMILRMLDQTGADVLAVVDTEGTGLGKAPKCFNFGATNMSVDPHSGETLTADEFDLMSFQDEMGQRYLLNEEQRKQLVPLSREQLEAQRAGVVMLPVDHDDIVSHLQPSVFLGDIKALQRVDNMKYDPNSDTVVFNRRLAVEGGGFLIKDKDFAIPLEFQNLTGIAQWMLDEVGMPTEEADQKIHDHYASLKNKNGQPAKIIFQAHNMPYDRGVISANFQQFNQLMDRHLISDTAKIARADKLAYDDTPVASFTGCGMPTKVYFYDSPYSSYSMTTFLERIQKKNKGGVFPDIKANILLRYDPTTERFSIIDRNIKQEYTIDTTVEALLEAKQRGPLPNNSLRYSVERMSTRAMIRNILLSDRPKPTLIELHAHEQPFAKVLEAFQSKYYFDLSPDKNIHKFLESFVDQDEAQMLRSSVNLEDVVERFLMQNKDIQARFHDGWIYEKVLNFYEPSAKKTDITKDVVEEINYYTDIPAKKVRQVLNNVIQFMQKNKIQHALVHEQHNNIRQTSKDGQGLADTVYECILPQMLGLHKRYNPFSKGVDEAANAAIALNVRGGMLQKDLGDDVLNDLASDSFSMQQMSAFDRASTTDKIQQAQKQRAEGLTNAEGTLEPIKFKLPQGILPPGSAIYALPYAHVDAEQIQKDSEMLAFIAVNEIVKGACGQSSTAPPLYTEAPSEEEPVKKGRKKKAEAAEEQHEEAENAPAPSNPLLELAKRNDAKAIAYREDLLTRYSSVEFLRHDATAKKILDYFKKHMPVHEPEMLTSRKNEDTQFLLHHNEIGKGTRPYKAPKMTLSEELMEEAKVIEDNFKTLCQETGVFFNASVAQQMMDELKECVVEQESMEYRRKMRNYEGMVRQPHFLPEIEIENRSPLKYALKHLGHDFILGGLIEQVQQDPQLSGLLVQEAPATRKPVRKH